MLSIPTEDEKESKIYSEREREKKTLPWSQLTTHWPIHGEVGSEGERN